MPKASIALVLALATLAAPARAQTAAKVEPKPDALPVEVHGTLRTMGVVGTAAESFGNPNFSAITAAANPLFVKSPSHAYMSLQVQQSRFSIAAGDPDATRGLFEVDFVHFDQSSPTTAAFPRLRIAQIEHVIAPGHRVFVGQGWEPLSPLHPYGYNLVGSAFQAGNLGFLRQQAGWTGLFGTFESTVAIGMPGVNSGPSFGNLERGVTPTGTLRLAYKTKPLFAGVSAIATSLKFEETRRPAWATNAFVEANLGETGLRAEGYFGQNTANLALLTLAMGYETASVRDAGGYLSIRQKLGERHTLHLTVGAAGVLNRADLKAGYTPVSTTVTTPVRTAANGPGIVWNRIGRVGYAFSPRKGLSFVVEPFFLQTRHHLVGPDIATNTLNRVAYGVEAGAMLGF